MSMNNDYGVWLGEQWGEKAIKALRKHDFDAHLVPNTDKARNLILDMVSGYETFGFGGSHTTRSIGVLEELQRREKTILDHWQGDIFSDENRRVRLEQGRCDCFFCSANAISVTGGQP